MGTNYYWHFNEAFQVRHIGKQSMGWVFSLEGHFDDKGAPVLASWADWREELQSGAGYILDEYRQEFTVEEFIARVEASRVPGALRQYDWLVEHRNQYPLQKIGVIEPYADWLDADGFSFHGGDFS